MRISELERLVRHHNHLYFVEKKPEISDYEFDQMVLALRERRPGSKVLAEIGSDLTGESVKVRHDTAMLSLDKAYDEETMAHWASKFSGDIVASPKIDGCAVSIRYDEDGELALGATRGNGVDGELITKNIEEIRDIPNKIGLKNVEIRGEIYMALSVFKKYAGEFANPRNLAAGAIKQKNPQRTAEYNLSFWGYDLLGAGCKTEAEKLKHLKKEGFPAIEWKKIGAEKIQETFDNFFAKRSRYDFETDGVVFKTNDISEQERLGATAHHPRYGIAYKFQGDSGETQLIDIEWGVARTGVITPVGIVEPVVLSGATVTRASLHNVGLMKKLGLSRGATVLMMRRGGVIPNLEKVVKAGRETFDVPEKCPSCGAPTQMQDDFLYCSNPSECIQKCLAELEHFIKTIDCDGFGIKLIAQLYERQLVLDPADFYQLTKERLMTLDRMGDVLAEKLIRNINGRRELPLAVFLRSLGIRELGRHVAEVLAATYPTLDQLFNVTKEELAAIHSIGEVIAEYVMDGLKSKRHLIDKLLEEVTVIAGETTAGEGLLSGQKFLFTGSMVTMGRKEAQKLVEDNGGRIASSVSKDLDCLVIGDGGGAGSKLEKATKLQGSGADLKIITESEFLKMIKENK